jgi:hypothetical protein
MLSVLSTWGRGDSSKVDGFVVVSFSEIRFSFSSASSVVFLEGIIISFKYIKLFL